MNASNNTNLPLGMGHSFLITIEQFDIDSIINNIFTTEISSKAFASGLFKGTMREYPSSDITPTKLFMLKSYGIASRKSIPMKPNIDSHICTIIVDDKGYVYQHNIHYGYADTICDMPDVNVTENECNEQFGDIYRNSSILRSFLDSFVPIHFKDGFIDLANSYYLYLKEYKSYLTRIPSLDTSFCLGSVYGTKISFSSPVHMNIMGLVLIDKVLSKFK